jgi:exonuclease SbcD
VEQLDKKVEGLIDEEINDLAAQAADQPMPRVLVGHFSVGGATYGSERSVMLGRDLVIPKSAISDPVWDFVALGHIHKHQNLTAADSSLPSGRPSGEGRGVGGEGERRTPPIVYSGSLERIDFGEEAEDKGFCWVALERGKTAWDFVKVNSRPFVTLKVDCREEDDPTSAVLAKIHERNSTHRLAGAIVRVSVRLREAQAASLHDREIEKALREVEVGSIAAIGKEIDRAVRAQLGNASPETLTPAQLVERYFISKGRSPEEAAEYVRAAESLFDHE